MSRLTVSTIDTSSNTTPLDITTGNTGVGITMFAANGVMKIRGHQVLKGDQVLGAGKQTMWLPAAAFVARISGGPALNQVVSTTNGINYKTYDFDPAAHEYIEMQIRMPKSWDKGTISYIPVASQLTSSAGAAKWNLYACVASAGDGIDVAYGTPVSVVLSMGTANTLYVGAESAAVTAAGSPQDGDLLILALGRAASEAADTLAIDARLHGINMYYTANTDSDL